MNIDFFFDPISPYAWLASTQLSRLEEATGRTVIAKPVLFAGLLKAHGHKGPAEIPAKRNYLFRDVLRRAAAYGVEMEGPPTHPFNPLLALRACIAIEANESRLRVAKQLMDAAWSQGLDITREDVVADAIQMNGEDAHEVLKRTQEPGTKQALLDATDNAIALGLFGVPTFKVDDQLFWGDDRFTDVVNYCAGQTIDESKLARILAREPSVTRR
jgi:2-hydroxychromene-2-carboxylate isomerase